MFSENLTEWQGRQVIDITGNTKPAEVPGDPVFRIRYDYDEDHSFRNRFAILADSNVAEKTEALVIGLPGEPYGDGTSFDDAANLLIENKDRFPRLKALFWGDFTYEENEVSWAEQTNISRLLEAYPGLGHFVARGAGIGFDPVRHICLESLAFQTGGLPVEIFSSLQKSVLPELKKLHIMTGDSNYGWEGSTQDIGSFLENFPFPTVTDLGIQNAEDGDEVVRAILDSGILEQIDHLDLSYGTVGDDGARLLLESGKLGSLESLTIERHYISEPVQEELRNSDCKNVVISDYEGDEPADERYVAVGE